MRPVPDFASPIETYLTDLDLMDRAMLNKGTAFTDEERDRFQLHGLLPPTIGDLQGQIGRRLRALAAFGSDFQRYSYLRDLQDTNETLFHALLATNLEAMLPLVYTPTVGEGCQRFSEIWRKPRGLFLSYPNKHRIREILANHRYDDVRVIVVSDGERILGLGDQGAGGMGIPIGKLALYTACAGIHPDQTLPIQLDMGTNNQDRLNDPVYIGWRHERVTGAEYDDFLEAFVEAVRERWPDVLLQWEDFAGHNAQRLLDRYRDRICSFNDDIQGTAAAAFGALMSAIKVTGSPLTEQRIALLGVGSAGGGIASLLVQAMRDMGLTPQEARARIYAVGIDGLLREGMNNLTAVQQGLAQSPEAVAGWTLQTPGRIGLMDVITNARPTVLIGVSGQAGLFTEEIVRAMAAGCARPIIFPLSNPTSHSEATPQQLLDWTDDRALVGTGSPFPPVTSGGVTRKADQTNNAYIFPGVGLAVIASGATRVTDAMFMAAGKALAELSPALDDPAAPLLPPVADLRQVAIAVALAVARQAQADGVADDLDEETTLARIRGHVWEPRYRAYVKSPPPIYGG